MKKTIVAMLVSGAVLFPGLTQAQTLEQSVAQSLATHPKIKEAFDLYQARLYQHDGAKGGYYPTIDLRGGVGYEKTDSPSTRGAAANSPTIDDSMTRKEAGISLRQMLFDGLIESLAKAKGHMIHGTIKEKSDALGRAGRIVVGLQVPPKDNKAFDKFLQTLGYPYAEETHNPVYRLFLRS